MKFHVWLPNLIACAILLGIGMQYAKHAFVESYKYSKMLKKTVELGVPQNDRKSKCWEPMQSTSASLKSLWCAVGKCSTWMRIAVGCTSKWIRDAEGHCTGRQQFAMEVSQLAESYWEILVLPIFMTKIILPTFRLDAHEKVGKMRASQYRYVNNLFQSF